MKRLLTFFAAALLAATGGTLAAATSSAEATTTGGYRAIIRRTSYGVPHIIADTLGGAAFGQGWAYGEDRFCDLMDMVVKVRGERSRWLGPGARGMNIATDLAYRQLDLEGLATQQYARLSTEERQLIDGYTAGYNGYLRRVGATRVGGWCQGMPWVGPVSAIDMLAYERDVALLASGQNFLAPAAIAQPPGAALAAHGAIGGQLVQEGVADAQAQQAGDGGVGSNGWALGADKSTTGKGALLANPHFPWQGELRFWESQLTVPGKLNVYGVSLGGLPGVQIGFTDKVSWTHTVSTGTRFTLYSVNLVPGSPTTYTVDGHPEAMASKQVTIQVDFGGGPQPYAQTMYATRYGPVLDLSSIDPSLGWNTTSAITYRDANIDNDHILRQWVDLAKAQNVQGIHDAVAQDQGLPWVNTLATDSSGTVYYFDNSQTPDLSPSAQQEWLSNPLGILNGSNSANAWVVEPGARSPGLIPFSKQPQLTRRDYVFNSNDSNWFVNEHQFLTGYSPLQGDVGTPRSPRTRQNLALIGSVPKFDVNSLGRTILGDTALTSDQLTAAVVAACQARGANPVVVDGTPVDLRAGCAALAGWNRRFDVTSTGAVLWRETIASVVAASPLALSQSGPLFGQPFNPADPGRTPRGAPADLNPLLQGMARAILRLSSQGLAPNVPLGQVQYTEKNNQRIPVPGANDQVGIANVVGYTQTFRSSLEPIMDGGQPLPGTQLTTKGYVVNFGTSFLLTLQYTAAGPQAKALLTFSESGNPASPHFADQTPLFTQKQLRDVDYSELAIATDPNLSIEVVTQF